MLITSSHASQTAAAARALSDRARGLSDVRTVSSPATKAGGRTALVVVALRGDPNDANSHVAPLEHAVAGVRASHPAVAVREAGGGSVGHAIDQAVNGGLQRAEMISIPITLLILVLAFGALAAASVPLLLALTSVAAAIGAGSLVSHLVPMGNSTAPVVVLIGLAVGVDYSLFYVRRERAERRAEPLATHPDAALQAASATVGRAIVVAGATVVIGLSGLLFTGFGVFTILVPAGLLTLRWARRPDESLEVRVDELTRTRSGVLDVQASELRRIERDLHDGAQARLVALSMQLGRAEERLADHPESAALVRRAREEAAAAIGELRDLARGIAPPVLADRGLEAAVQSLADRAPSTVTVNADIPRRPPPVVETAAYFVVAEALTNAAKHAPGAAVRITLWAEHGELGIVVADDGLGGADPLGGGLTGLRQRVEALDGWLEVESPVGEGTTVRASLPCES